MKKLSKGLSFFLAVLIIWTLFFPVFPRVLAFESSFDYVSGISYEPIAKLVNFLNDKKSELEKLGDSFTKSNTVRHRVSNPNNAKARTPFLLSAVLGSVKDTVVSKSKQYFGKVFCVAKDFVFPGACQSETDQDYATATDQQEKTSAEDISAIKQQYDDAIAEANILNQKFNALKLELGKIKAGGVVIKEPIIEQKTVERTIEKIISGLSQDDLSAGIASIRTELSNLNTNLTNQINNLSSNTSRQSTATFQAISLTNRIDSLTGVRLSGITINGVSGLTDSDIPDTITASNYLPLSGGTISGDLTIIGNATLGVITLQNATAGYFTATSTTASIFPYASTTALTVSGNSYLGTVSSGLWSGTTIAVNKGGTGQTSFGQGWLNSDGTTLSASTSPTVNYIVATSTRSSIFPYASTTALTVSGTGYFGNISNTGGYTQSGTSENTFTGTPTFSNATYSALFTGGNVGVGTTSPDSQAKLHVDGGVSNALRITGSTQGRLLIEDTGATANQKLWEWMSDGGLLQASLIDDAQSNRITYLTINNSGNIGIGTTSPNWKLSVSGQGSFDDFVRASYLTATSTTATSTFPLLKATTAFQLGTDYLTDITGTGLQITNSALTLNATGDWTGTFDGQDGTYYLSRANHTGTQNVSTLSNYDWTFANNYGTGNLTASSSSIALWARGGINASSTSHFVYASTTALSVSGNSYLGTVSSGIWNGSSIGDAYIDDTITLTNLTQITNRAISDTTGTLTVARGGTGQTSFGQGWLNSDGSTLSASTSPTVNYIYATSTTATSTFAGGLSAVGDFSFGANSMWYQNGQMFLMSSTTSAGNLTIGYQSATGLDANGGQGNSGLGYQALGNATSTNWNTALGYQALKGSATISGIGYNTAVGYQALLLNTTGNGNNAIGYQSLRANTTGGNNAADGMQALATNTTGNNNNAIGYLALLSNTSGSGNTANGFVALRYNTTGTYNTGIGYQSGVGLDTAATADQRSVIDTYMTFIGYQASRDSSIASTTALTNGTAIGKNARVAQSNAIVLGGTGSDAVNVAIGTTSPWAKLSIQDTYGSQAPLFDIASSTSAAYATSSLFRVNANGNVGIGTTSPYRSLSVADGAVFGSDVVSSYFTATSTTATSTFPLLKATTAFQLGTDYITDITGTNLSITNGVLNATGGGASADWVKETNYGALALTASTTIPIWAKDAFYASSTSVFQGLATFGNASTSQISATKSYLGTVLSGIWNGTAIGLSYGGTGQTSFGQGWLNSDGTTLSASTSPTVAYLTATSTTATSTLTDLNFPATANIFYGGQRFLTASTTTAGNLTIGYQSATGLDANGGLYNTAVGYQALGNATSTNDNTALGYQALKGSATISNTGDNTAVGYKALTVNTTGVDNTAVGYQTLVANTTGIQNTAVGKYALSSNTTGFQNVAIGRSALRDNLTGSSNFALGTAALAVNTGSFNAALGASSFTYNTSGLGNIGLGYLSGVGLNTAGTADQRSVIDTYMTFIGYQASRDASIASTTVLTNGIAIGKNARVAQSNAIVLGGTGSDAVNVAIGTTSPWAKLSIQNTYGSQLPLFDIASSTSAGYATSSIFRINADGNVGIGTTSPYAKLSVSGDTALDSMFINFASSTAPSLTLNYLKSATSTIPSNTNYAWSIATSTTASPIFSISTLGSGARLNATTTINGGFNLDNGALTYDYSSGITSINALEAGPMNFDNDAGIVSWMDMAITAASATSTKHSYTAQIDSNPVLTVYGESDGVGNAKNLRVGIGTTTPLHMLSIHNATTTADADLGFTATSTGLASFYNWTMGIDISDAGKFKISSSTALGTSDRLVINGIGSVGMGTTTPWRTLSVTGTVGFDGLTSAVGAGSLCLDSNKQVVYNSASDACLSSTRATKHDIQNLNLDGISIINQLQPSSFIYNQGDGRTRYGFIAEDTALVDDRLATHNEKGEITGIDDRAILGVAVKAIKELNIKINDLQANASVSSGQTTDSLFSWILGKFSAIGIMFGQDKLGAKKGVFESFEMKDATTGEDYCVKIRNGEWEKTKGTCGETSLSSSSSVSSSSSNSSSVSRISSSSESSSSSSSSSETSSSSSSGASSSESASSISSANSSSSSSSTEASSSSVESSSSSEAS